jgi:hypothetical protein
MSKTPWLIVFWYLVAKWRSWRKKVNRSKSRRRAATTRRQQKARAWEIEILEREYDIAKRIAKRPIGRLREELGIARSLVSRPIKAIEKELKFAKSLVRTKRNSRWY